VTEEHNLNHDRKGEDAMARTISTNHFAPNVNDEGLVKRYGLTIAIAVLCVALFLFFAWATDWSEHYSFGSSGHGSQTQGTQGGLK
jgi:hypothetical protein